MTANRGQFPTFGVQALACVVLLFALILSGCNRQAPATTTSAPAPAPIATAPKPTTPLAQDAKGSTPACPATYQTAAPIHGPVSQGACFSCHQQDQGNHHYPLARNGSATCTFC